MNQNLANSALQNLKFQENMAELVREKLPPRIAGAEKGAGFYGEFRVTADISNFTKAKIFSEIGNSCNIFLRFSKLSKNINGFALKFYTDEGNWDIAGSSIPVYFCKNPLIFLDFLKIPNSETAQTFGRETAFWEFWTKHPESLHALLMQYSGRSFSQNYLSTDGFGVHTFSFYNAENERFWVKFHFKSENKNSEIYSENIYQNIQSGNYPKLKFLAQIMTEEQAQEARWNPFDPTKVWLHEDFPLMEVGEIILNKIPENYQEEVEKSAFSPTNILPGIGFSPDEILQSRLSAYTDSQRYRIGNGYKNLAVNQQKYLSQSSDFPIINNEIVEIPTNYYNEDDHYTQAGLFYTKALDNQEDRDILIKNIVENMQKISGPKRLEIINRQLCFFFRANIELGMKIASNLNINIDANLMSHAVEN